MSANLRAYDSIVQILALLFYGMSSCSSVLIPGLIKFLDALVSLKPILFSDFVHVLDDRTERGFKTLQVAPKRRV